MSADAIIYARAQMGVWLGFHIIFAAAGVALPLLASGEIVAAGTGAIGATGAPWLSPFAIACGVLALALAVLGAGVPVLVPALVVLYRVFKRGPRRDAT